MGRRKTYRRKTRAKRTKNNTGGAKRRKTRRKR
jgi:hypothetical protein